MFEKGQEKSRMNGMASFCGVSVSQCDCVYTKMERKGAREEKNKRREKKERRKSSICVGFLKHDSEVKNVETVDLSVFWRWETWRGHVEPCKKAKNRVCQEKSCQE